MPETSRCTKQIFTYCGTKRSRMLGVGWEQHRNYRSSLPPPPLVDRHLTRCARAWHGTKTRCQNTTSTDKREADADGADISETANSWNLKQLNIYQYLVRVTIQFTTRRKSGFWQNGTQGIAFFHAFSHVPREECNVKEACVRGEMLGSSCQGHRDEMQHRSNFRWASSGQKPWRPQFQ